MKFRFDNMDAGVSAFFNRQLEQIRPGLIEQKFPELKSFDWVPMGESINPGAESYVTRFSAPIGDTELHSTMSARGPRADITVDEAARPFRSLQAAYGWTVQEIRAASMASVDLSGRKARAARQAIAQRMDDIHLLGDGSASYRNLFGLFKLTMTGTSGTGVNEYTVPADGTGSSKLWSTKSADLILRDLNGMANKIPVDTNEAERADTLLLPLDAYQIIATLPRSSTSDTTVLSYFLGTNPYIKKIESSVKLMNAGAGGSVGRAVVYRKDADIVEAIVPVMFEQQPPERMGWEWVTECHARTGGLDVHRPKSILYADGISG